MVGIGEWMVDDRDIQNGLCANIAERRYAMVNYKETESQKLGASKAREERAVHMS